MNLGNLDYTATKLTEVDEKIKPFRRVLYDVGQPISSMDLFTFRMHLDEMSALIGMLKDDVADLKKPKKRKFRFWK